GDCLALLNVFVPFMAFTANGLVIASTTQIASVHRELGVMHYLWMGETRPILHPQEKREPTHLSGGFSSTYSWYHRGKRSWID
ncbi:hypothetical protein AVEN_220178-1, partial [Araneus ventricosus]